MTKLRCALVGIGHQGREHLEAAMGHPDVDIVIAVDRSEVARLSVEEQASHIEVLTSLDELEDKADCFDAFILALPHHVYEDTLDKVIKFCKPILKEKPLGRDYLEAKRFMSEANKKGIGLQTAIQRRTHSTYRALLDYLKQTTPVIDEVYARLHLGKEFRVQTPAKAQVSNWRGDKVRSGGGALLDAGYHMFDLVYYLVGDFEVVSATTWQDTKADDGTLIDDRGWVLARTTDTWIMLDIWVGGEMVKGKPQKSEYVELKTNQGLIFADRESMRIDGKECYKGDSNWSEAMKKQLTTFANNVKRGDWSDNGIWDQLPIIRQIEKAYWLSRSY